MWPWNKKQEELDFLKMDKNEVVRKFNEIKSKEKSGKKITRPEKKFIREVEDSFYKVGATLIKENYKQINKKGKRFKGLLKREIDIKSEKEKKRRVRLW
ncbi:hypothetical protein H0N95_01010, partial [Candidatus Micrarchaeota archaeon]|nr:hypothetical protein [Candidatus Micrarchaeota archaeon]